LSRFIDISLPLRADLACWPGSPGFRLERVKSLDHGDEVNESVMNCGVHFGTHVDAPLHFVQGGAAVDDLLPDVLVGPAVVACLPHCKVITAAELESLGLPPRTERLLLHTGNSSRWRDPTHAFARDYVALSEDAATWVVERGVRLLGVDYLSVQLFGAGPEVHHILLKGGVVVLEGLNLDGVASGDHELLCLPLKLVGAEGAPARALLRTLNSELAEE